MKHYDIIIIGSGIAGISLGSILSKERKVAIIEKEKQLSYHSTGRSFAFFIESYGNNAIIELTKISKKFFYDNFNLFLKKKGVMFIGNNKQKTIVEDFYNEHKHKVKLELFSKNETIKLANCLNEDYVNNSVIDINASEIDVNNLYEYLSGYDNCIILLAISLPFLSNLVMIVSSLGKDTSNFVTLSNSFFESLK